MSEAELRIWIVVRDDLEMPAGKMMAQVGHAVASLIFGGNPETVAAYMRCAQPKITVRAKNLHALERARDEAEASNIGTAFITDAGRTVFPEPTPTVCGIGPCFASDLPQFVRRLRLM